MSLFLGQKITIENSCGTGNFNFFFNSVITTQLAVHYLMWVKPFHMFVINIKSMRPKNNQKYKFSKLSRLIYMQNSLIPLIFKSLLDNIMKFYFMQNRSTNLFVLQLYVHIFFFFVSVVTF